MQKTRIKITIKFQKCPCFIVYQYIITHLFGIGLGFFRLKQMTVIDHKNDANLSVIQTTSIEEIIGFTEFVFGSVKNHDKYLIRLNQMTYFFITVWYNKVVIINKFRMSDKII